MGVVRIIGEGYYAIETKGVSVDTDVCKRIDHVFQQVRSENLTVRVADRPAPQVSKDTGISASTAACTARPASTYTVKSGDTLSKIAKEHLGDANRHELMFEANKDQVSGPDKIKALPKARTASKDA